MARLTAERGRELYERASWPTLAERAGELTNQLHGDKVRTYVIERNINYTNVCRARCSFCAFSVSPGTGRGYVLSEQTIADKIQELLAIGGTQILLQGGLNPDLTFDWYENVLGFIRSEFPGLHIHAFSPPEVISLADQSGLTVAMVLERLRQAGLDSIPGGGAEILVERVRREIAPGKCTAAQWLSVMRQAHRLGIYSTATMMFGHVENLAERIEHLEALRSLQDESRKYKADHPEAGLFTAFTCWPFQSGHTSLEHKTGSRGGAAGAVEQLKMTALARLYLDNIDNIQASWVTQGPAVAQVSLAGGCNDIGSLMMEENVVAAAGTSYLLELESLKEIIRHAGFKARQRDYYYNALS